MSLNLKQVKLNVNYACKQMHHHIKYQHGHRLMTDLEQTILWQSYMYTSPNKNRLPKMVSVQTDLIIHI